MPVALGGMTEIPQQGADLMPRTAVCIDVINATGAEYRVGTPRAGSDWYFTVKAAKEMKTEQFPGHVAPRFIHHMAQSENLLPILLAAHRAPIAIPATRDADGVWKLFDETAIRGMGLIQSARRFLGINAKLQAVGQGKSLQQRIDERGKLVKQEFRREGYLLLAGAGGKHICAACIPVAEAQNRVVDQTLYWKAIESEMEAWFCVGMLNSHALTEAITLFNPKGAFGERHIHALPYRLIPALDRSNEEHLRIAELAREIAELAGKTVAADPYLRDPTRALTARRKKLRAILRGTAPMSELERLCAAALGTTALEGDDDGAEDTEPDIDF